jgi:hypothetical protein
VGCGWTMWDLALMRRAISANATSTFAAVLADTSTNGMACASANPCRRFKPASGRADLGRAAVDDPLRREVALVADEEFDDAVGGVALDLRQPIPHVVERRRVGDVVHDHDAVRAAVVGARDRAEALLAGGVPLRRQCAWGGVCGGGGTILSLTTLPSTSSFRTF